MFTGIIQEIGTIREIGGRGDGRVLVVEGAKSASRLKPGDSVAINGACQTAVRIDGDRFEVYAMAETIARTNFKNLRAGSRVNLELPLTLNDPLGGHLVAGHVDDVGVISSFDPSGSNTILKVTFVSANRKYLIEKGSVAIDGISLTVFDIKPDEFSISWIPETIKNTVLQYRKIGDEVNLEFDLMGKYIENFMNAKDSGITMEFLHKHGFTR